LSSGPRQEKWVRPDYGGGGIVNLMSSIAARFGGRTGHRPLALLPPHRLSCYKKIVLVVLDGLGWEFLARQGGRGFLRGSLAGRMTSVFPSTTASAVATFATGAAPSEHGVSGWFTHLRELGSVSKILFSGPRHGGGTYPGAGLPMDLLLTAPPLFPSLMAKSFVVTPNEIAAGDFAKATSRGAIMLGYQSLPGFCLGISRALEAGDGPTYVSAYWPELDSVCHHHGVDSRQAREHFLELDAALGRLFKKNARGETLFLFTADHGLADTPAQRFVDLGRHPALSECLSLPLCGEPRLAYCYVHPDRAAFFKKYVAGRLGRACRLYTRRRLLEGGYYGPGPATALFSHRIGDFILAMHQGWSIRDFLPSENRVRLSAGHGGMTPEEMLVPLVVAG
jgi:hypothetical protein